MSLSCALIPLHVVHSTTIHIMRAPLLRHHSQVMSGNLENLTAIDAWACTFCDVEGASRQTFLEHLHGKRHQLYLRFGARPGRWLCTICPDVEFPYEQQLQGHINGKDTHHQAMSVWYYGARMACCDLCRKPLYHDQYSHEKGHKHQDLLLETDPDLRHQQWYNYYRNNQVVTLDMQRCLSPMPRVRELFFALDQTSPEHFAQAALYVKSLWESAPLVTPGTPPAVITASTEEEYKEQRSSALPVGPIGEMVAVHSDESKSVVNGMVDEDAPSSEAPATAVHDDHGAILYTADGNMVMMVYDADGNHVLLPLNR